MSCVTNPLKDRPSAYAGAVDAYGAKKAYTGERRVAFIAYDPTTPRGELRRTGNIGNRTSVTNAGDVTSYTPNNLNQYTQRQISEMINLRGSAETGATVTVKMGSSQSESVTRQEKYWHKQLTSTNDTEAQYPLIKVVGVAKNAATNGDDIVTIETGHVFVAKTPEQFTYDEDGNLLSDGRWEYTWNGENRLVSMETATNKVGTTVPVVRLEFVYDYQGRRISKTVYEWDTTNWVEQSETTYLYDYFNLISETTVESGATNVSSFVFGLDLSGSRQGAGGVGGLLAEIDDGDVYFPCFDANGNVSEYVSTNGTVVAHREYSPFGKTLVSSGTKKSDFTHWFSTKPFEEKTGLVLYEFRIYIPDLGRFGSKDPLGEFGGLGLYSFVFNRPVDFRDVLGLCNCGDWRTHFIPSRYRLRCLSRWDPGCWGGDILLYSWSDVVGTASLALGFAGIPVRIAFAIGSTVSAGQVALKFDEMGRVRTETAIEIRYDIGKCQDQYCIEWGALSWWEDKGATYDCKMVRSREPWSDSVWDFFTHLTVGNHISEYEWGKDNTDLSKLTNPDPCSSSPGFSFPGPNY